MGFLDILLNTNIKKEIKQLKKQNAELRSYYLDPRTGTTNTQNRILHSFISACDVRLLSNSCGILATAIDHLITETFRNGIVEVPIYQRKCINPNCGKEFNYTEKLCDECLTKTSPPPYQELKILKEKRNSLNENEQSIYALAHSLERDLDEQDNAFLFYRKSYTVNKKGEILAEHLEEILRQDPLNMELIIDDRGNFGKNEDGTEVRICLEHRNKTTTEKFCELCGKTTYKAAYKTINKDPQYFLKREITHRTKYVKGLTMGYSPIYSIAKKAMALQHLDDIIYKSYKEQRPPKGFMVFNIAHDALEKVKAEIVSMLKQNPNAIPMIAAGGNGIGGQTNTGRLAEFINSMGTSQDQQLVEHRDSLRRMIAARYGVMPLFTGDIATSSGLNTESQQTVVSNKAVERAQKELNEGFLTDISKALGAESFRYQLSPATEKDDMKELQIENMKIQNAQMMQAMGFEVERDTAGEFNFSGEPVQSHPDKSPAGLPVNTKLFEEGKDES